jgi:exopolysaccharide biosynthesis polyprenyl glycosylphosphotransferase
MTNTGADIQGNNNASPAGTVFQFPDDIYRQKTMNKQNGDQLLASGGTSDGAVAITNWAQSGNYWGASGLPSPRRSGERLLLVGSAKALNRINALVALSPVQVIGCVTVGERAAIGFPLVAHIDTDGTLDRPFLYCSIPAALDRVLIIGADLDEETLGALLNQLEHLSCEIAFAPVIVPLFERGTILDPSNCIRLRAAATGPLECHFRRTFDMLLAIVMLTLLSPIMLVIAALVRLESPGPALFRQTRWGLNNQPFTLYKFRSMWVDAPGTDGSVQASRGDGRVTRLGAILRRSSLDELPQLFNVIGGTMSLVGPRPHPADLNHRFMSTVNRYLVRHRVLPGMTGLAQVNGYRGETHSHTYMQRRIDYDLKYVRDHNFGMDLWILVRTIWAVLSRKNAY